MPQFNIKYVFYWGVAALAVFALAGPMPKIATMLVLVLITGVVLTHYKDYVGLFTPPPAKK
jgi:hypothetical protein